LEGADPSINIAKFAGLFSDATRVKILLLLSQEKDGATTMDICTRLGLPQPRVSSHLSILLQPGVVSVDERGRQRVYTLGSRMVASLVNGLASLSVPRGRKALQVSARALKEVRSNSSIRQCRSCYDHLAGVAGVELLDKMLEFGWLLKAAEKAKGGRVLYGMTPRGAESLRMRGVDVGGASKSNRMFAFGCPDWTERRPHLGGSLGRAILDSALAGGIVERKSGTRTLRLVKPISSLIQPT
jgi:DNA-binding transcriptional ArsR family regulator